MEKEWQTEHLKSSWQKHSEAHCVEEQDKVSPSHQSHREENGEK